MTLGQPSVLSNAVSFLVQRSLKTYAWHETALAIVFGSSLELGIVPFLFVRIGQRMDRFLEVPHLLPISFTRALAAVCFLLGVPWLASSIYLQHQKGGGTPFPLVPTKKLLMGGPYRYTRNPMALGAILWLSGWALIADSLSALVGGVGIFSLLLISYHKMVEEKELSARFGQIYEEYKARTPFFIPRLRE